MNAHCGWLSRLSRSVYRDGGADAGGAQLGGPDPPLHPIHSLSGGGFGGGRPAADLPHRRRPKPPALKARRDPHRPSRCGGRRASGSGRRRTCDGGPRRAGGAGWRRSRACRQWASGGTAGGSGTPAPNCAYKGKARILQNETVWANAAKMPPGAWYEMYVKPWHPELARVGMRVLSPVISASSCERNSSAHGHIHTKIRNRLDPATTEKLVCVYSNSKLVASSCDADKLKMFAWDSEDV